MILKSLRLIGTLILACQVVGCLSSDGQNTAASRGQTSSNSPPNIGGSPQGTIKIGDYYSFTPSASDPDGDPLTYSVQNKPVWAQFNTSTGQLSGQPTLGNVGVYDEIAISVSDQTHMADMPSFSITVTQVALASTTLSWAAPTQNVDGTPLLDLAGYRVYYGQESGMYSDTISIDNPGLTTIVVDNLVPGTYYFAAASRTLSGVESSLSNEIQIAVN
jgi:hypothetical protein